MLGGSNAVGLQMYFTLLLGSAPQQPPLSCPFRVWGGGGVNLQS